MTARCRPRRLSGDPGDRNGEPAEGDLGCLLVGALAGLLALVIAELLVLVWLVK